jgi:hypothetical protein
LFLLCKNIFEKKYTFLNKKYLNTTTIIIYIIALLYKNKKASIMKCLICQNIKHVILHGIYR